MKIPRRRFVKLLTFGTATSLVAGKLWQRDLLAFCELPPGEEGAVLKIRLSDYPALQQAYGSVRLGINPISSEYPDGDFYPILINRDGLGDFHVLDCECRHAGCVVPAYDSTQFVILCPCHGSRYDVDGSVVGGPATEPLYQYQFELDGNDTLAIHIPCWAFKAQLSVAPGGAGSRVQLDFPTFPQVTYRVGFREHLQDVLGPASFAATPSGPANQTSLTGLGTPATIYLDRTTPTGYYTVSMDVLEI
ncbi:MAG: ubiquinol-cytochrome c reductase iron-sulfur subunit [Verrucomicrobiota bacterium]|nr:ubiquinol-cytochrome c reductase iron-sulfur subunit [Verrucomicrobiota bacterium]MCC6822111.1 ubiquinol-cytochrome c reductase iron-sulfur subunit [Limisphaerales bacterium]